jgi:hypothetical protein
MILGQGWRLAFCTACLVSRATCLHVSSFGFARRAPCSVPAPPTLRHLHTRHLRPHPASRLRLVPCTVDRPARGDRWPGSRGRGWDRLREVWGGGGATNAAVRAFVLRASCFVFRASASRSVLRAPPPHPPDRANRTPTTSVRTPPPASASFHELMDRAARGDRWPGPRGRDWDKVGGNLGVEAPRSPPPHPGPAAIPSLTRASGRPGAE